MVTDTQTLRSLELVGELAIVLSCSTRLSILLALADRPASVGELCEALDLSQSLVSHHLADLRKQGLVESVRNKKCHIYQHSVLTTVTSDRFHRKITLCSKNGKVQMSASIDTPSKGAAAAPMAARRASLPLAGVGGQ
jgi:DNA-binding transcriptional ArsR family regulator